MVRKFPVLAVAIALVCEVQAQADDEQPQAAAEPKGETRQQPVEKVTVAATRQKRKADVKDIVRFEPGVSVRANPSRFSAASSSLGRDGNSGFNVRGLEGNRVLIQIDGIRMPDDFALGSVPQ